MKEIEKSLIERVNDYTVRIGGITMGLSYIPQILKILKTKNVQGISLIFLSMVTIAVAAFALDGYVIYKDIGDKRTMIAQLLNFIPAVITVTLILIYR